MKAPKKQYSLARDYVKVGEFLRDARVKANLTQREVSEALGYTTAQHISNFECGIAVPPLKKLEQLVRLYKLNVNTLLELILDSEREVMLRTIRPRR
jgi:transcriptional regulator with XRE-family HTH domain